MNRFVIEIPVEFYSLSSLSFPMETSLSKRDLEEEMRCFYETVLLEDLDKSCQVLDLAGCGFFVYFEELEPLQQNYESDFVPFRILTIDEWFEEGHHE